VLFNTGGGLKYTDVTAEAMAATPRASSLIPNTVLVPRQNPYPLSPLNPLEIDFVMEQPECKPGLDAHKGPHTLWANRGNSNIGGW